MPRKGPVEEPREAPGWRRHALLLLAGCVVIAGAVVTSGLGSPGAAPDRGATVRGEARTFLTYMSDGHQDVLAALQGDSAWRPLAVPIAEASATVVRVRVVYNRRDNTTSVDHGSGFVLHGGRHVVTAAHVVDVLDARDDCEIRIALSDGRVIGARALVRTPRGEIDDLNDWAVLELDEQVEGGLRVGRPRGAPSVAVLGFPEQIGLSPGGAVVADAIGDGLQLLPIVLIGELVAFDVEVAAGSIPLGGISGGPVIDERGVAVAIETGVRRYRNGRTGDARWVVVVNETDGLRRWLHKNVPAAVAR